MYFQYRFATDLVGEIDHHATVKASGSEQCFVEYIGLIGRGQYNDTFATRKAIHLSEDLIEGLFLFARSTDCHRSTRATDSVEFVDENNRRRVFTRLLEKIAYPCSANPHNHLDKLRRAHGKERHASRTCDGTREKGFTRSRGSDKEHSSRGCASETCILLGILKKIHDLDQFIFCLVDTSHIVEGDFRGRFFVEAFRATTAEPHHAAHTETTFSGGAEYPHIKKYDEYGGAKTNEECDERVYLFFQRLRTDDTLVVHEEFLKTRVNELRQFGNELVGFLACYFNTVVLGDFADRRYKHGRLECSGYCRASAIDFSYVSSCDLLFEEVVRHNVRLFGIRIQTSAEEIIDEENTQQPKPEL